MAGIAGIIGNNDNQNRIKEMLEVIRHRGPETFKIAQDSSFSGGVVASKLSESRGNGFAKDGDTIILFDGDIYNKRSLVKSDAEVVLELYKKYGYRFPGYLEGVYAGAVWNGKELILARDPVGCRPLYWGVSDKEDIYFASELKALVGKVNDVYELRPGTIFSSDNGIRGYLFHYPEVEIPDTPDEAAERLKGYFFSAVERRLKDGAVGGVLLSGGLDSTIIAAITAKIQGSIPAFTVGIKDMPAPDLENAKIVADYLGIEHHVYQFSSNEIKQMIPKAVWFLESFDEDCISGTIANLNASLLASKHTNCILSGEGADELFGGYHLLKDLKTEDERFKMMSRLTEIAYNTAVQRLDRSMMGNSINYRAPFIDPEVMAFAIQMPVGWKIHLSDNGELIEKWLLREAFKDMIPEQIYKRVKLRFSAGTGTDSVMDKIAKEQLDLNEFNEETRRTPGGYYLNSPKELLYYRIFKEKFPDTSFEKIVGRWDPNK
ncbi:MAG: asparagine synthase-related protein [Thermodesulfobacteriota bacterium]|nr:asparagine synthase-related protein [Thermodesulfobacteriota bacterium]